MTTPLDIARKNVGFAEGPDNANRFGKALGFDHEPWCALFVTYCYLKSGHKLPSMQAGMKSGYAGVFSGMEWAKANGLWRPSWEAEPNDAIVYGGPSFPAGHTGLIVHAGAKGETGATIEGNRGDAVRREVFTVGADYVLGTIALSKLLHPHRIVVTPPAPKPAREPQPTPAGQTHTGPVETKPHRKPAPKPAKESSVNLGHYKKSIVAVIGAVGTWALAALPDGTITSTEWTALGVAIATALGVYQARNKAKAKR